MKNKIYNLLIIACLLCFATCEVSEFGEELQIDPNTITPNSASPDFLLNEIQIEVAELLQDLNRTSDEIMRYTNLNDSYSGVADPSSLNFEWIKYYALLEDASTLNGLIENDANFNFYNGMSKILTSLATVTMVDYLGDIPFSQANRANEGIFNPSSDDDNEIYNVLIERIRSAKSDFSSGALAPETDLYYNGDESKWIKLANSLEFKMLVNMKDQTSLNNLIAEDNFISSKADDFEFKYSEQIDPLSQHPDFVDGYVVGGQVTYMGNSFINLLMNGKTMADPRIRYYLFRQVDSDPPSSIINCPNSDIFDFCYLGNFYLGRDHGDVRPSASDRNIKTIYGLYPVGGAFDANNAVPGAEAAHFSGTGILPILLSSFIDFYRAEAAISLNTTDDPATLLESGIRSSMDKVTTFLNVEADTAYAASQIDIDNYVNEVMDNFNAADDNGRLDIILEEFYLASYGNSTESYNGYRRTGYPSSLQIPIENENVPFPRTFSLPVDAVNSNSNLNQRSITTQVFWDTNPAGFIK